MEALVSVMRSLYSRQSEMTIDEVICFRTLLKSVANSEPKPHNAEIARIKKEAGLLFNAIRRRETND